SVPRSTSKCSRSNATPLSASGSLTRILQRSPMRLLVERGVDPGHLLAQLPADDLDLVTALLVAHPLEALLAGAVLGDPLAREGARLDLGEDLPHRLAGLGPDDPPAAREVAVLGRVGDRVAHAGDALLVHEIDDQLELVQDLEVGQARV